MKRPNKFQSNEVKKDALNTKLSDDGKKEKTIEVTKKPLKATNWTRRFCIGLSLILFFGVFVLFSINSEYIPRVINEHGNIEADTIVLFKQFDR